MDPFLTDQKGTNRLGFHKKEMVHVPTLLRVFGISLSHVQCGLKSPLSSLETNMVFLFLIKSGFSQAGHC